MLNAVTSGILKRMPSMVVLNLVSKFLESYPIGIHRKI